MQNGILQASSNKNTLVFDPRTKLLLLLTMSTFVLAGAGNTKDASRIVFSAITNILCIFPFVLLCGESGCGKTTLTRVINGLIPHYYEGELSGDVIVKDLNITKAELYETTHLVGSVFQNPRSQFFCVDATSEIAFGCENLGLPVETVIRRVEEVAANLEIEDLLGRNIFELSGGEKQKIASASVSALHPDIFVLDEPTSNLDVEAIESLKKMVQLWKSEGKTIIIAEHRLHWLKDVCDRVVYMKNGKIGFDKSMKEFLEFSSGELNQYGLRALSARDISESKIKHNKSQQLSLRHFKFSYEHMLSLNMQNLDIPIGSITAIIGHNGAGKSTLVRCLCGLERKFKGIAQFGETSCNHRKMLKKSYMVLLTCL